MLDASEIKPLIAESSTSESTNVEVVLNDIQHGTIVIPDYQRDSDQWDGSTKSLLVESIINNLSIPAFFLEVDVSGAEEVNKVIDGQQRLTTLHAYYLNKFPLVPSEDAPYLTPNCVHYAGKTYAELPKVYQQAFKRYRLTVIKLRNIEATRLEIFRRINQGGTPLSGQDIRLAYYSENSPSVALIRLAGVYDISRQSSARFLSDAHGRYGLDSLWRSPSAAATWRDWWQDKEIAHGQRASEMFLWAYMAANLSAVKTLLGTSAALQKLNARFNNTIDEALDVICAQLQYQDSHSELPPLLMPFEVAKNEFFPFFEEWFERLLGRNAPNLPVSKNRLIGGAIGAAHVLGVKPITPDVQQWTDVAEFIRRPQQMATAAGIAWPLSKGRWDGKGGYRAQTEAIVSMMRSIFGL